MASRGKRSRKNRPRGPGKRRNYQAKLNAFALEKHGQEPRYELVENPGGFTMSVYWGDQILASVTAPTRQKARQAAALQALEALNPEHSK